MESIKRAFTPVFKAKVAIELIRERDTMAAICSRHSIHPTQAGKWKEQALKGLESIFIKTPDTALKQKDELIEQLYKQVGRQNVELEWIKKKVESVS